MEINSNADKVQGCARLRGETSAARRHVCVTCPAHQSNNRVAQRRHDLWDIATPHLRAIFIKGHIPDPMGLVLNMPLATNQREQTRCVDPLWRQASHAGYHFLADFPCLFHEEA